MSIRIAIDIGGTFTDMVAVDTNSGQGFVAKVLSTPSDFSKGVIQAIELLPEDLRSQPIKYIVHGTTVVTNTLLTNSGPVTAVLTTQGFRDVLLIGRQDRDEKDLYNLHREPLISLVPRERIFGIPERIDASGKVLIPLDTETVHRVVSNLYAAGIRAIAVCFLNSYRNNEHERHCGEVIRESYPEIAYSLSSEVDPTFREFERFSATVVNAYSLPVVKSYLTNLVQGLRTIGVTAPVGIFTSNGGMISPRDAEQLPILIVESGPAGGVVGCSYLASTGGYSDVVSFDMGGTTAKVGLIVGGEVQRTHGDYKVVEKFLIRMPLIDTIEVGTGGGSIAWIDKGGLLRVGPESAGADPGPACYGHGGTAPTITDALLVLGMINPHGLAGGRLSVSRELAEKAIAEKLARPLGLEVPDAAQGILRIASAAMIRMIRRITIERGLDPGRFTLVAYGGAGPLVGGLLARDLSISTVIVPALAGVYSASGMLNSDHLIDFCMPLSCLLSEVDPDYVKRQMATLMERGQERMNASGIISESVSAQMTLELRYKGQGFELPIQVDYATFNSGTLALVKQRFHEDHQRVFGFSTPRDTVELVNVRVSIRGRTAKVKERVKENLLGVQGNGDQCSRSVYWNSQWQKWKVFQTPLKDVTSIVGPAAVDMEHTTIVVPPEFELTFDERGNAIMKRGFKSEVEVSHHLHRRAVSLPVQ